MSKNHRLNITKITRKDYKRGLWKISKSFQKRKRKRQQNGCEKYKETIERTLQNEKNAFLRLILCIA